MSRWPFAILLALGVLLSGTDPVALDLVTRRGDAFIESRNAIVALPHRAFAQAIDTLAADPRWQAGLLARILEVRRAHPETAASFDAHLRVAMEPSGRRRAWLPADTTTIDLLAWEAIFHHELAVHRRDEYFALLAKPPRDPEVHVPILLRLAVPDGLLAEPAARTLGKIGANHHDPRIVPALRSLYLALGAQGFSTTPPAEAVIGALLRVSSPSALEAVLEIRAYERARLTAEGYAPWDEDIHALVAEIITTAEREAALERRLNADPAEVIRTQLAATVAHRRALAGRLGAHGVWRQVEHARTVIERRLGPAAPVERSPSGKGDTRELDLDGNGGPPS